MLCVEDDHLLLEHAPPTLVIPENGFSSSEDSTNVTVRGYAGGTRNISKEVTSPEQLIVSTHMEDFILPSVEESHSYKLTRPPPRRGECSICLKYCVRLDRHMLMHSGDMPFTCPSCGKCFRQSIHLARHLEIHGRINVYKCEFCGRTLTRKDKLKEHKLKACKVLREY